jgi:hypothetical protein
LLVSSRIEAGRAQAAGGTIDVKSHEGKGSTFTAALRCGIHHLPHERMGEAHNIVSTATRTTAEELRKFCRLKHEAKKKN